VPFVLAERARSECARSMRTVKGSLDHSAKRHMVLLRDPRWTCAVGDKSSLPSGVKVDRIAMIFRRENTPDPFLVSRVVFEAIRELMAEPTPKSRRIGFKT
jgi:hypothetical protein